MHFAEIPEIEIDLSRRAAARWEPLRAYRGIVEQVVGFALADAGIDPAQPIPSLSPPIACESIEEDLSGMAEVFGMPRDVLLAANLYYDAIKSLWGCTGFALDTPAGPLHARNLDWNAGDLPLSEASVALRFVGGACGDFVSIGWPGMVGVLSAFAPGRFSVSLNAVSSDDPVHPGTPVVFLLRRVMEQARDFTQAVALLRNEEICSDCILLLAGTKPGDMAVIERTPLPARR